MENVRLNLEKYRGKWYARGQDAFGIAVRRSLLLNDSVSESDAARQLGLLEAKINNNGGHALVQGGELTVDVLVELYYEKGVAKESMNKVKTVGDYWGRINISSVNEASVLEWERSMLERGLAPATIKRYNNVLKAIVNYGCKSKSLPPIRIPSIGNDSPARRLYIHNEDRDVIISFMDDWCRRFFTVLAWSGARPKELIMLKWHNVDLRRKKMTVKSYKGDDGQAMTRTIPYSAPIQAVFDELSKLSACQRSEYVFKRDSSMSWADYADSTKAVAYRLYEAARLAGYEVGVEAGITLYAFRHTFGTNAGNNGSTNALMLSAYMGHKDVQTTKDNYFHGGVEDAEMLVQGLS
tara:strand:- start:134 stop:1189 length:1056 start_codon:yes stop_codon:yes gene_type:complete